MAESRLENYRIYSSITRKIYYLKTDCQVGVRVIQELIKLSFAHKNQFKVGVRIIHECTLYLNKYGSHVGIKSMP